MPDTTTGQRIAEKLHAASLLRETWPHYLITPRAAEIIDAELAADYPIDADRNAIAKVMRRRAREVMQRSHYAVAAALADELDARLRMPIRACEVATLEADSQPQPKGGEPSNPTASH